MILVNKSTFNDIMNFYKKNSNNPSVETKTVTPISTQPPTFKNDQSVKVNENELKSHQERSFAPPHAHIESNKIQSGGGGEDSE